MQPIARRWVQIRYSWNVKILFDSGVQNKVDKQTAGAQPEMKPPTVHNGGLSAQSPLPSLQAVALQAAPKPNPTSLK